jgi:hypothetical protein
MLVIFINYSSTTFIRYQTFLQLLMPRPPNLFTFTITASLWTIVRGHKKNSVATLQQYWPYFIGIFSFVGIFFESTPEVGNSSTTFKLSSKKNQMFVIPVKFGLDFGVNLIVFKLWSHLETGSNCCDQLNLDCDARCHLQYIVLRKMIVCIGVNGQIPVFILDKLNHSFACKVTRIVKQYFTSK